MSTHKYLCKTGAMVLTFILALNIAPFTIFAEEGPVGANVGIVGPGSYESTIEVPFGTPESDVVKLLPDKLNIEIRNAAGSTDPIVSSPESSRAAASSENGEPEVQSEAGGEDEAGEAASSDLDGSMPSDRGTTVEVDVTWSCENYDAQTPGEYIFEAEMTSPDEFAYNAELPEVTVTVLDAASSEAVATPTSFVAVTDIVDVSTTAVAEVPLQLSGTVLPPDATNRTITWEIKDSGDTGALLDRESLLAEKPGEITLIASVRGGLKEDEDTPYVKEFKVPVLQRYTITNEPAPWSGEGDMTFTIDAPFADFIGLTLDGQEVVPENYEKAEGSTIITFKENYLTTLTGTPLIRAEFRQGFAELWPLGGNVVMPLVDGKMSPDEDGIELKLNGKDVPFSSDGKADIVAGDGDRIDFTLRFTESNGTDTLIEPGDVFSIELPDIFDPLSESMLDSATKALIAQGVFEVVFTKNGNRQTVTITKGTVPVLNFIISFYAILDDIGIAGDVDEEIEITDSSTVHITTTPSASTAKDILGRPSPINTGSFTKGTRSHAITQAQLDENSDIGNAWNYLLHVNTDLSLSELTGAAEDTLPKYTRLFAPSAPGDSYSGYDEAFRSFEITYYRSNAKKDMNDQWYMAVAPGTATEYLEKIRAIESAQGRDASGVTAEQDPKIYISDSIASRLMKRRTGDNQEVLSYTSSFSIGYKIDPDTNTASFYTINTYQSGGDGQGYAYVPSRSGEWQDSNDPCVPLYSNPDTGYVTRAEVVSETTIQEYDDPSPSHGWVENITSNVDGTVSFAYLAPNESTASFTLTVKPADNNDVDAQESFEVDFNVSDPDNPLYGSKVTIKYRIYFNQGWLPQDTGVLEFTNHATYESSSDTATGEYTFTGGGSSAVITAEPKTVSREYIAHDGGTTLTYALPFRKNGNEVIDINDLRVYDSISQYLEILIGTIRIKLDDQYISTNAAYSADANTSGVGLSATYNETNHQLFITNNLGNITTNELITVEFQARVRQDVKYGTQITNTFAGRTVETTVDHRLDIRKVDATGNPITVPATFSVSYTTDSPSSTSPVMETLLGTNGQPVSSMATSTTGVASLEYRLDEDEFYLKLEETAPPFGYTGLNGSIWIQATRNREGEMSYTLADPLPTGLERRDLIVNSDGSASLTVANTTAPPSGGNTPPGGGNTPPGGGNTPPGGGDTPPGGGDTPPGSGGNNDNDDPPEDSDEPPRYDLRIRKTVSGSVSDAGLQRLFPFQIVKTRTGTSRYGTGSVPLSTKLSPGTMQVIGDGIDESRITMDGEGNPTILLLRHGEAATIQNLYRGFYQIVELYSAGYTVTYHVATFSDDIEEELFVTDTGGTRELYLSEGIQVTFKNTAAPASPENANPSTGGDNYNPQTGADSGG